MSPTSYLTAPPRGNTVKYTPGKAACQPNPEKQLGMRNEEFEMAE